jgi:IS605 OrfB family transposase
MASSKGKKKQKVKRNHSPKKANGVVRSAKIPIKLESELFERSKEKLHSNFRIAAAIRNELIDEDESLLSARDILQDVYDNGVIPYEEYYALMSKSRRLNRKSAYQVAKNFANAKFKGQIYSRLINDIVDNYLRSQNDRVANFNEKSEKYEKGFCKEKPTLKLSIRSDELTQITFNQLKKGCVIDFENGIVSAGYNTKASGFEMNFEIVKEHRHTEMLTRAVSEGKPIGTVCIKNEFEDYYAIITYTTDLIIKPESDNTFNDPKDLKHFPIVNQGKHDKQETKRKKHQKRYRNSLQKQSRKIQALCERRDKLNSFSKPMVSDRLRKQAVPLDFYNSDDGIVGIDPGCSHNNTLVLSDGMCIRIPIKMYYYQALIDLLRVELDRKQKNSNRYKDKQKQIADREKDLANLREDWVHKVSKYIADHYNKAYMEDIGTQDLVSRGSRATHRELYNAAFNKLKLCLKYKMEERFKSFGLVKSAYTSQICSNPNCQYDYSDFVKKDVTVRVHHCPCCGLKIDRDLNASIIHKQLGVGQANPQAIEAAFVVKFNEISNTLRYKSVKQNCVNVRVTPGNPGVLTPG